MNDPSSVAVSVPQIVLTDFPGPELTGKITIFTRGMAILCSLEYVQNDEGREGATQAP